ncbi:MAG TPA: zinc-ribbon domain-containing protein [Bryobacteraceae bacterium]
MFCDRCGTQVRPEQEFCSNCGQSFAAGSPAASGAVPPPAWAPPGPVQVNATHWIGAGWDLVKADMGSYALAALVFFVLSGVPFIQGALITGFHIYTMKKMTGRRTDFGDLFKGFNYFIPTLVAMLLIGAFTMIGTVFCIIPGLVVAAALKFTYLFIVDKRMDFWPAMQASHAVVKQDYFGFTMFLILAALVNVLGLLCCVVGLLVTFPLTIAAITVAYREIVGFDQRTIDAL